LPDSVGDDVIQIIGAREHNLKNLSLAIPRGKFVVVTGVSGSGKSTLAFDLLFAEGQRRFLDSMNAYARQFVEQMARPDVDRISGLPPTVSIEQRNARGGGKSTVATVTEVYHFVRLLFARLGTLFCPDCQQPVAPQTRDELGERLRQERRTRGELLLLAPVVRNRKGFHTEVAAWAARHGYAEVRADGELRPTRTRLRLDRFREHNVEIVIGRLPGRREKVADGRTLQALIEEALRVGEGTVMALDARQQVSVHSTRNACAGCGRSFAPLDPRDFSYNSPRGWCPKCRGFGELFYLPAVDRGARAEAIEESWFEWQEGKRETCPECNGARLNPLARSVRLALPGLALSGLTDTPQAGRAEEGITLEALGHATVSQALTTFRAVRAAGRTARILQDLLPEVRERLRFLEEVGLGYLQLGRSVPTLSGGEAQRIRLAAQLGSNLSGVLYILDEPTIGLHARDNDRLLKTLARLRERGNSLVVVEHDDATMRHADCIIDLGPGAGARGGEVVAVGSLAELLRQEHSVTGRCLRETPPHPARGQRRPVFPARPGLSGEPPGRRRRLPQKDPDGLELQDALPVTAGPSSRWLTLHGARTHNLKNLTVAFPLRCLVVITGVSGSGKSTLIRHCLAPALGACLKGSTGPIAHLKLEGAEHIGAVHEVDQSPIGRTPRSVPATFVGFFDDIRALFSQVPEARLRGYGPGRFSFNSPQGRCPDCEGAGVVKLEMNFMPPAFVRCETCGGSRFNLETLEVQFQGRTIAQVLDLTVAEARECFHAFPRIRRALDALHDTGLDYLRLGQTSPTLSGGEAQRVKLVTHLLSGMSQPPTRQRPSLARDLFILEEPTIGLHMADVQRLVEVLQRLVDHGHSVFVIEHNLDLIAEADWVIDLGPGPGEEGGRIVAAGPPEAIAQDPDSHTGRFLQRLLRPRRPA
jgi:excinuclease ABC subunit A